MISVKRYAKVFIVADMEGQPLQLSKEWYDKIAQFTE